MKYASIEGGIVAALYEYETPPQFSSNILLIELPDESPVLPGWLYSGEEFTPPQPLIPQTFDLGPWITVSAFRSRFTPQEKVAIEMAALDKPEGTLQERTVAATLRTFLADVAALISTYLDVSLQSTLSNLQQLEALGILSEGRAEEILSLPIKWSEAPTLTKQKYNFVKPEGASD